MSDDTELGQKLDAQIRATGPMSLSTYMGLCLTHPTLGYYQNFDPLGVDGDFITAPEISQMFGEFIGLWIAGCWQAMGSPTSFDLVELGPGRGTLMNDALRVVSRVDGASEAMRLNLLETNTALKDAQRQRLGKYNPRWISEIDELDDQNVPLIVVANEFFDALPIKQYQKQKGQWHERAIGLREGKRGWGLAPSTFPADSLPKKIRNAEDGSVWEAGLAGLQAIADLSSRIVTRKGALLAIDYGYEETQTGETFQALEKHQFADPLANPGQADLTAHVDFEALATAATVSGATAFPIKSQSAFLDTMGIQDRAAALVEANPELASSINAAKNRLIGADQMGILFKTLCIASPGLTPYPFGDQP